MSELNTRVKELAYQVSLGGKCEVFRGGNVKSVRKSAKNLEI